MEAAGKLGGERCGDRAMAGDAGLAGERGRYYLDLEVGFALRGRAGVAGMAVAFIDDFERHR